MGDLTIRSVQDMFFVNMLTAVNMLTTLVNMLTLSISKHFEKGGCKSVLFIIFADSVNMLTKREREIDQIFVNRLTTKTSLSQDRHVNMLTKISEKLKISMFRASIPKRTNYLNVNMLTQGGGLLTC